MLGPPPPPRGMLAMLARPRADAAAADRPEDTFIAPPRLPPPPRLAAAPPPRFAALARSPPPLLPASGAVAATLGTITGTRAVATARSIAAIARAVTCPISGAIAGPPTITGTVACAIARTVSRTALIWTQHLVAVTAAEIHPVRRAGPDIVVAEALLNVGVVVAHAAAMRRIVLPAAALMLVVR